jgi:CRISPR-associated exonuclease Cas4
MDVGKQLQRITIKKQLTQSFISGVFKKKIDVMTLTPSHIIEYLFCPRFTYFEYVLRIPQHEEKFYKVMKGRDMHKRRASENVDYLRVKPGVKKKLINRYLSNGYLRGEVDEVLELSDGSMAPLDYKFAQYKDKIYDTYKTQMYCYSWLIMHNYNKDVNKAFLVYTRSRNKLVEVPVDDESIERVKKAAENVFTIIGKNMWPRATKYKKRCVTCTYKNICIR